MLHDVCGPTMRRSAGLLVLLRVVATAPASSHAPAVPTPLAAPPPPSPSALAGDGGLQQLHLNAGIRGLRMLSADTGSGSDDAGSGSSDPGSGLEGDFASGELQPRAPPSLPPPGLPPGAPPPAQPPPDQPPPLVPPPYLPPPEVPPAAPPTPALPPLPPALPPPVTTHQVVTLLTVAGTVEDYDANVTASLAATFAAQANVSVERVSVSVSAASVLLTVAISTASADESGAVESALASALSSAAAASSLLGVTVETLPVVATYSVGSCLPGTLDLTGDASDCVPCPPGYACAYNTTRADLEGARCPRGFYCPGGGATPTAAPDGHHAPSPGLSAAVPCAPGTYARANASIGTSACWACPSGYECAGVATPTPTPCGPGTYRDAASGHPLCADCAIGFYSGATAATSAATCVACGAGLTSVAGATYSGMCVVDPRRARTVNASPGAAIVFVLLGAFVGGAALLILWAALPHVSGVGASVEWAGWRGSAARAAAARAAAERAAAERAGAAHQTQQRV